SAAASSTRPPASSPATFARCGTADSAGTLSGRAAEVAIPVAKDESATPAGTARRRKAWRDRREPLPQRREDTELVAAGSFQKLQLSVPIHLCVSVPLWPTDSRAASVAGT